MECEESEPELQPAPVPASTPSKNENESSFGIKLLQGVFVVLVIAILLGMILHLLSKDSLRGSRKSFQGGGLWVRGLFLVIVLRKFNKF